MAIDPNISLAAGQGTPRFDFMQAAAQGLKLGELMAQPEIMAQKLASARAQELVAIEQANASRAAQKLTAEQTAAAEQKRKEEERQIGGKEWLRQNAGKYFIKSNNTFNHQAMIDDYLAAGHPPEQLFKFREEANKESTDRLKTDSERTSHAEQRVLTVAGIIARLPKTPEGERQARSVIDNEMESLRKVVGDDLTFKTFSQRFGESLIPGSDRPQVVTTPGGGVAVAPPKALSIFDRAQQAMESTRTEQERVQEGLEKQKIAISAGQLAVARRTVALAEQAQKATDEDKDPNSKSSQQTRDMLQALQVDPKYWQGKSTYDISRNEVLQGFVKSAIPTVEMREKQKQELEAAKTEASVYTSAIESADKLTSGPTAISSFTQSKFRTYVSQNDDARRLQAAIDAYNKKYGTDYTYEKYGKALVALLKDEEGRLLGKKAAAAVSATAPSIPQAVEKIAGPGAVSPAAIIKPAPEQMVTVTRLSDKAKFQIPKSQLQGVLSSGQYERVKE